MRHPFAAGLALGLALLTLQANADSPRYNQISLRAEVHQAVSHDTLQVVFFTEAQDADPAKLAERITRQLNQGLETARQVEGVKVSSGNRSSHPVYDEKRQSITAWRERGEILVEGSDFAAIAQLTSRMLGNLSLGNMQFSLSPGSRRATEDELIKQAIDAFRNRADIATRSLGGSSYQIVSLGLNTQYSPPPTLFRGVARMAMADAEMSAPNLEGGQSDVTVSADGVIEVSIP
jgi:predicted secreted protein